MMGSGTSKNDNNPHKITKQDLKYFLKEIKTHAAGINDMAMTPDCKKLLTVGEDTDARLIVGEGRDVHELEGHEKYINCVVCNDKFAFTAAMDGSIRKWSLDIRSSELGSSCIDFKGHAGSVNRLLLTNKLLFSTSYDRTSKCWHVDTGECLRTFNGHRGSIFPILYVPKSTEDTELDQTDLQNSHDFLVTGSADCSARLWALSSRKSVRIFNGHTGTILSLASDGGYKTLYTGSMDHSIRSYNMVTGDPLSTFKGHKGIVLEIKIVNRLMFSSSADHTVKCWLIGQGELQGELMRTYVGHTHTISAMTLFDKYLITGSGDSTVRVYDAKDGRCKRVLRGHTATINKIIVNELEDKLYSASNDSTVRVWNWKMIIDDIAH